MLERVSRRAARIVVVSENTRRDLETHFPASRGKIQIIYPGLNPQHRAPSVDVSQSVLKKHGLAKGYLLYVGNLRASKNTPRLIAAYSALRASMPDAPPLVLAGKNFLKELSSESLPAGVKMLGAVEGSDLPALYANASIFVFPSLYEGFGLPPLEAMACGAPVLTSWAASLPEVCGKAAVYVDPLSEASIAEGIKELLMSPSKREELIALGFANIKRFSWARFAASTWQVYHDAMA
jgi:glycosyltransferase involved in cell wall biosynthesis